MPITDLFDERFISLTTFRRDQEPVATPVWAAPLGDRLVIGTFAEAGKLKRLAHTPQVTVAPCNFRGLVKGPAVEGTGRILDESEIGDAVAALTAKYGWQWKLFGQRIDTYITVGSSAE